MLDCRSDNEYYRHSSYGRIYTGSYNFSQKRNISREKKCITNAIVPANFLDLHLGQNMNPFASYLHDMLILPHVCFLQHNWHSHQEPPGCCQDTQMKVAAHSYHESMAGHSFQVLKGPHA